MAEKSPPASKPKIAASEQKDSPLRFPSNEELLHELRLHEPLLGGGRFSVVIRRALIPRPARQRAMGRPTHARNLKRALCFQWNAPAGLFNPCVSHKRFD